MKAQINGILVEGTPEEIHKLLQLMNENKNNKVNILDEPFKWDKGSSIDGTSVTFVVKDMNNIDIKQFAQSVMEELTKRLNKTGIKL